MSSGQGAESQRGEGEATPNSQLIDGLSEVMEGYRVELIKRVWKSTQARGVEKMETIDLISASSQMSWTDVKELGDISDDTLNHTPTVESLVSDFGGELMRRAALVATTRGVTKREMELQDILTASTQATWSKAEEEEKRETE